MNLFWKFQIIVLTVFISLSSNVMAKKLKVLTSSSILADMVRNVGQHHIEVTSLVGPDGDAHVYEPRPSDVKTLKNADLFIIYPLLLFF